jgi:hypothetical protein
MNNYLNELSKAEKTKENQNKYNLRSKQKEGKPSTSNQPKKSKKIAKKMTTTSKENEEQNNPHVIKAPILEIKEILKYPSSFSFENEIHKIKIPVPFLELIKNEQFKRYLSKILHPEPTSHSTDSMNLQDEKPTIILGPLVEDKDDSSPPFTPH